MSESRELQSAAVAEYSRPSVYTADQPHAAASRVASLHAQYGATTATINMCPGARSVAQAACIPPVPAPAGQAARGRRYR